MPNAANRAKSKWNSTNYDQIKVSVRPEIATAFKAACAAAGLSIAGVLSKFMAEYGAATATIPTDKKTSSPSLSVKKNRSSMVRKLALQLEQILEVEQQVMDNIPENLYNAGLYDEVEERVGLIEEAIVILNDLY